MKLNALPLIMFLTLTTITFSQQEVIVIDREEYDQKYSSPKNIKLNENTHVFKFAPLNMIVGEINFGYERQISQKGSLDFEIGPTISKIGFNVNSHLIDQWSQPTAVDETGLGVLLGIGYRFYPLDNTEALNRFYVSPTMKYKVYNHFERDLTNTLGDEKGQNSNLNFTFKFGYQTWLAKSFSMDFYAGLGIGYQQRTDHSIVNEFNGSSWGYKWQQQSSSGARYVFTAGIKIGIGKE